MLLLRTLDDPDLAPELPGPPAQPVHEPRLLKPLSLRLCGSGSWELEWLLIAAVVVERTLVKLITADGLDSKLASVKRAITGVESFDFEVFCRDLCFCCESSGAPGDKLDVDDVFGEVFAAAAK